MHTWHDLFLSDIKRRLFDESQVRIHRCLDLLNEDECWFRPNPASNSIGNLVLHLNGNIRQWILTGLDQQPDHRIRQAEFDEIGPIPVADLRKRLDLTMAEVVEALNRLDSSLLTKEISIQGFRESGISILIHVVEHFSYHTGQITYITKMLKNRDLRYYGDADLNITGKA